MAMHCKRILGDLLLTDPLPNFPVRDYNVFIIYNCIALILLLILIRLNLVSLFRPHKPWCERFWSKTGRNTTTIPSLDPHPVSEFDECKYEKTLTATDNHSSVKFGAKKSQGNPAKTAVFHVPNESDSGVETGTEITGTLSQPDSATPDPAFDKETSRLAKKWENFCIWFVDSSLVPELKRQS